MSRDDTDEIHRGLNDALEDILSRYWSGWITEKRKGQDIALLTPRVKEKGRKPTSSFQVTLSGSDRGKWYRFSLGAGGGALALIYYGDTGHVPSSKSDWAEAYKIAKDFLGIEDRSEAPEDTAERERRKAALREQQEREAAQRKAEAVAKAEERKVDAKEAWQGTFTLRETLGEGYLVERGLPPISEWPWNPDEVLRFHPALDFEPDHRVGLLPAIVGKVQDPWGNGTSVWQIYLQKGKPFKADLSPSPKVGRGPSTGGAVRLGGIASHIGIAEGIETALAAWVLEGFRRPVWAGLSTSGVSSFEPPFEIERITIVPDSDKGLIDKQGRISAPPGITAAKKLQERMKAAGIRCTISELHTLGDALDLLQTRNKYEQKGRSAAASSEFAGGKDHHRESVVSGV